MLETTCAKTIPPLNFKTACIAEPRGRSFICSLVWVVSQSVGNLEKAILE